MSISNLTLFIIVVLIAVMVLFFYYRKGIQRMVDNAISKSVISQLFLLLIVIGFVFGLLMLIMWLTHKKLKLEIFSSIFAFINPGSFFSDHYTPVDNAKKLWAIIIGVFGMILLGGLLISVFNNILERRVDKVKNGKVSYLFNNHVIIIGYDNMVIDLTVQLANKYPMSEIILQTLQEVPKVRHELFSKLPSGIEKRVTIVSGNRNASEDLEVLRLHLAKTLFILGENGEQDRDTINMESLRKIDKLLINKQSAPHIPCYVLFENQSSYAILQQQDISVSHLIFHPFNISELWAQKLFVECNYKHKEDIEESIEYLPLDREGISHDSDKTVHLVVLGMSKVGVALGIQASHLCHFPNFLRDNRLKTRITYIDENADREMYFLQGRYHHLFKEIDYVYEDINSLEKSHHNKQQGKFTDIEWHFVKGRVEHPVIRKKLKEYAEEKNTFLTIAVCFGNSVSAIACGLYLPDEVYKKDIQILVKQDTPHSVLAMLNSTAKYGNVKPFGTTNLCFDLSKNSDLLPMIVNYVYGYYYDHLEVPESVPPESEMEKSWKKLSMAKKWSNRYNANMVSVKQRSFDIYPYKSLDERMIGWMAEVEHNRWNIEELLLGFRPTTPEERKEIGTSKTLKDKMKANFIHNDICPYHAISDMDMGKIKNTREFDICLSKAIPMIVGYIQEKEKNNEKKIYPPIC